ncbi:MAG: hypothetical protein L3J39_17870 [Verrucomicrobiales bacterium]|nr:hypothetical protein [Verrucomicrobiales bacterium]
MQNEDEEMDGLEQKLSHLKPRQLDEPLVVHLSRTLQSEATAQSAGLERAPLPLAAYPANVMWMRFAPIAAAAGVVLLGTFFMHYQSNMNSRQGVMAEADAPTPPSPAAAKVETTFAKASRIQDVDSVAQAANALPVPRLGVAVNGGDFHSLDSSLLPVSGQNYLRPLEGRLDFNQGLQNSASALHFAEAYHWKEGQEEGKMKQSGASSSALDQE